jgi:CheY-like chemotaxis protein
MAGMDGFEVIRRIRARERETRFGHIGIVVVSAMSVPGIGAQALETGADAFRPKPFDVFDVVRTARKIRRALRALRGALEHLSPE